MLEPRKLLRWYRFYKVRDRDTPFDARRRAYGWTGLAPRQEHADYWQTRDPDRQPEPEPESESANKRTRRSSFLIAALRGE